MDSHAENQALDFTSCPRRSIQIHEISEPPILDLSCKKHTPHAEPSTCHDLKIPDRGSPANFAEAERKSPLEVRAFMVTPPSESDSPKKTRYEPVCPFVPTLPPLVASSTQVPVATSEGKKVPRPFKAYPKDPLTLSMGPAELIYDQNSNEAYSEFRKRMLESVRKTNEGTNTKMRRVTKSPGLPTSTMDEKDAAYWERRRKNNEAAKRSRDARRAKEDEIAIRAAFLEQENMKLKYELVALRNETAKLRCMVYST